jgi:hypothetical protein
VRPIGSAAHSRLVCQGGIVFAWSGRHAAASIFTSTSIAVVIDSLQPNASGRRMGGPEVPFRAGDIAGTSAKTVP